MTLEEILQSNQPYFGDFLIAEQGPYAAYATPFRNLVNLARASSSGTGLLTILEVGSWAGGSLKVWDEASDRTASFIVVDQWLPYLNDPGSECHQIIDEAARSGQIEKLFKHNMKTLGIADRISVCKGNSHVELKHLHNRWLDIAFIDGDHRYHSAKGDIEGAMALVREGGILCGDDLQIQLCDVPGHLRGQHGVFLLKDSPNAHLGDGTFYHPGVTQAVSELLGPVSTAGRLWAVQKRNGNWVKVDF